MAEPTPALASGIAPMTAPVPGAMTLAIPIARKNSVRDTTQGSVVGVHCVSDRSTSATQTRPAAHDPVGAERARPP